MPIDDEQKRNLIIDLGLDKLPAAQQTAALLSIGKIVFESVLLRALEVLSDAERKKFGKLIDEGAEDEVVFAFLKRGVPDIERIVSEEVERFREESIRFMKKTN